MQELRICSSNSFKGNTSIYFHLKGCKAQEDCNDLEDCDLESSQCVPLQCTEPLQKVGGIIHLEGEDIKHKSVGATGSFRYYTY